MKKKEAYSFIAVLALGLASCAFDRESVIICPVVPKYTKAESGQVADEIHGKDMPETKQFLRDYVDVRRAIQVCQQRKNK